MYRLEAASETIRALVPPALTEALALLTVLGDPPVLGALVVVLYWLGDARDRTATLLCYALVAVALTVTLKEGLALPRPPASVRAIAADPGSHGFPSGHAIGAATVYGGLLLVRDRLDDARVAVPAVALIGLIGLSRVAIGVHYLGDVLVGFVLGGLVLAGLRIGGRRYRRVACLLAAAVAVPGVVATGGGTDALLALGAGLGAFGALVRLDPETAPPVRTPVDLAVVLVAGTAAVGAVLLAVVAADTAAVTLIGGVAAVAFALAAPLAPGALRPTSLPTEGRG